jgi:hypothetical protein
LTALHTAQDLRRKHEERSTELEHARQQAEVLGNQLVEVQRTKTEMEGKVRRVKRVRGQYALN